MTNQQINIAIAEFSGWTEIQEGDAWGTFIGKPNRRIHKDPWHGTEDFFEIPKYCNDFNAMHEAEQFLWNKDWSARATFVDHLARILNPVHGYHKQDGIDLLDATARDRAEAFLKTICKWEEQVKHELTNQQESKQTNE
jgi:hypothetical protein